MKDHAPSVSVETTPPSPEDTTIAEADANVQGTGDAPGTAPEQTAIGTDADNLENALNTDNAEADILELTPEEQGTKTRFEKLKELQITIRENATPRINSLEAKMNTVQNKRDTFAKKALMLEYREKSRHEKAVRLGVALKKAEKAAPGSRRHNRLLRKYGKTNRKLGEIRSHIGRLDGAAGIRADGLEHKISLREKQITLHRDMLKIDKKVALAKKERRRLVKKMEDTSSESERGQLKQELARQNIGKLRQKLLNEAMRRYEKEDEKDEGLES